MKPLDERVLDLAILQQRLHIQVNLQLQAQDDLLKALRKAVEAAESLFLFLPGGSLPQRSQGQDPNNNFAGGESGQGALVTKPLYRPEGVGAAACNAFRTMPTARATSATEYVAPGLHVTRPPGSEAGHRSDVVDQPQHGTAKLSLGAVMPNRPVGATPAREASACGDSHGAQFTSRVDRNGSGKGVIALDQAGSTPAPATNLDAAGMVPAAIKNHRKPQ